jgi:hypothetical protein
VSHRVHRGPAKVVDVGCSTDISNINTQGQSTHPGRYYRVLHSTRVVPVIFKRKITGIGAVITNKKSPTVFSHVF